MVNAFAGSGGLIVVFRGLLERADTPEELAGVLAHEIQHVLHRDTTRAIFREASTGILVAALAGDVSAAAAFGVQAARVLGDLRYSREAEQEAAREDGKGPIFPDNFYNNEVLHIAVDYVDLLKGTRTAGK